MPAYPTTVSLRSDADYRKGSGPENVTAEACSIVSTSAGGRNSQPPRDRRRPGAAG